MDDRQFRYISKSKKTEKAKLIRARLILFCEFSHCGDEKHLEIFGFLRKKNEAYHHASNRETACKSPRTTVRARVRVANPSKSSELSDLLLLRLLPTATHSCILQQFCCFLFRPGCACPPYSSQLSPRQTRHTTSILTPLLLLLLLLLQFKNAHWVRCVHKEDENPSPNFLKYVAQFRFFQQHLRELTQFFFS